MGATKCPRHGIQIASVFCEHASDSVDARTTANFYLQKNKWAWYTLCDSCITRRDEPDVQDNLVLVCGKCIVEWAEATDSDYVKRCQDPVPEFPKGDQGARET